MLTNAKIAYFSMEIGLESRIPTYAGGLGVLAGDTLRAASDLGVPTVAVTLLHRQGYFDQRIDEHGEQTEHPSIWRVEDDLIEIPGRVSIELEKRTVRVRAWRREIRGVSGFCIPVLFLDTDLDENDPIDRALTGTLYGGDSLYRLRQEALLGIGGVRMLRALGANAVDRFHMNEGHAAFLAVELLREIVASGTPTDPHAPIDQARRMCVLTTHTPVPAGHDRFSSQLVRDVLGDRIHGLLTDHELFEPTGELNMTGMALKLSRYVNGVARSHRETTSEMYSGHPIDSITNGVHIDTWASPPFKQLFDHWIPGWRTDNLSLRFALGIPENAIRDAHARAKHTLIELVDRTRPGTGIDPDRFTIGFARRATAYKRPELIFKDLDRLRAIASSVAPFQIIYAGKAHPDDRVGKDLIRAVHNAAESLKGTITVVYLPGYDMDLARLMTAGADLWLNTPTPPMEASGTSGMKAAINAVPSLSVLDGWWHEGCVEGVTGWGFRSAGEADASVLCDKLASTILPLYRDDRAAYARVMRAALAINGSFFNTERMLREYVVKAYFPNLRFTPMCPELYASTQAAPPDPAHA